MSICAQRLTRESFARFGAVHDLTPDSPDTQVVVTAGGRWADAYLEPRVLADPVNVGCTTLGEAPLRTERMERHVASGEAILGTDRPLLLVVAPSSDGPAPRVEDLEAFVLLPRTMVVLDEGVWHDACLSLGGATSYVWISTNGMAPSEGWVEVVGGPVDIEVDEAVSV